MTILPPEQAANRAVGLTELLAARERRRDRQQAWLTRHPATLVVLTSLAPGALKDSPLTRRIFNLGWQALRAEQRRQGWRCLRAEVQGLPSGGEGFLSLQAAARQVKQCCIRLEDMHPAGRLWDIDVLDAQGRILSRDDGGLPARRCLLCDRPARLCARQRRHDVERLLAAMEETLNAALAAR
ncbi:2'-(5''-triphosphoribosyl)-3'-dephospho-CoA:apo-citrate lyase [Serratia rubidaea]|nr:2'-(5''-triphosphoribosyl)-3'-dephospho-CoA:apo-citrate lyase [Serratia rubidaea]